MSARSRHLVEVRCRRNGHLLLTLDATSDGRLQVEVRHHPFIVFDPAPRAGRFDVMVFAESEDDDPNSGPPKTYDYDADQSYAANCSCAQHIVPGTRLARAKRDHQRIIFSDPPTDSMPPTLPVR